MIEELRQRLRRLEKPPGLVDGPTTLPLGAAGVDGVLGGGLLRGALHEIAALGEAHVAAATGFAAGVASLIISKRRTAANPESRATDATSGFRVRGLTTAPRDNGFCLWIAEEMSALESGSSYGPGLDDFGLAPERLIMVQVAQRRDLLWAMEEALHCRAVACVIGEIRHGPLDTVAVRRLSLAAAESGALALLLRAAPADDASTAATRWVVGAASGFRVRGLTTAPRNDKDRSPRVLAQLIRNRRGPRGQWILEWSGSDGRFTCAAHAQPVAQPPVHRPHHAVA